MYSFGSREHVQQQYDYYHDTSDKKQLYLGDIVRISYLS